MLGSARISMARRRPSAIWRVLLTCRILRVSFCGAGIQKVMRMRFWAATLRVMKEVEKK